MRKSLTIFRAHDPVTHSRYRVARCPHGGAARIEEERAGWFRSFSVVQHLSLSNYTEEPAEWIEFKIDRKLKEGYDS